MLQARRGTLSHTRRMWVWMSLYWRQHKLLKELSSKKIKLIEKKYQSQRQTSRDMEVYRSFLATKLAGHQELSTGQARMKVTTILALGFTKRITYLRKHNWALKENFKAKTNKRTTKSLDGNWQKSRSSIWSLKSNSVILSVYHRIRILLTR